MDLTIYKIYEIQNKGKGIITSLIPDNLLLIGEEIPDAQSFQDVLNVNPNLTSDYLTQFNNTARWLIRGQDTDSAFLKLDGDPTPTDGLPITSIGIRDTIVDPDDDGITSKSLDFNATTIIFKDTKNSKGVEYAGAYETNFTGKSLITKDYVDGKTTGSETKVNAGTNVTVTGNGTIATPYIINSTATGATALINSGITTVVTGDGSIGTPYIIETVNLQKIITTNYTLISADNNYSIIIDNGASPLSITVPAGLPANFFIGLTQRGSADVTIVASSTTISTPIGLKIKGQYYHAGLEQIGSSNTYTLIGNTKT